jgi:peptidoglycan/xylan/chitin deacetylase (PgdA/CDA1 family)
MASRLVTLLSILLIAAGAGSPAPRSTPALPPAFVPPPILMYHRVDVDRPADAVGRQLTVSPEEFAEQLSYLKSSGITAISMAELEHRLAAGEPLDHVVAITFDDGYADQFTYALPILRRFGAEATFYIVTETVDTPRHLTWAQLKIMRAIGQDIAAHGLQHEDLSLMTPAGQARQIEGSISALQTRLHARIDSYGYPSGRFNRETLALMREAGVDLAVTTDPAFVIPPENRFELPRLRVQGGWNLAHFASALEQARERAQIVRS